MTVSELVDELKKHDPELMVIVDGYEGGFDEPMQPKEICIVIDSYAGGGVYGRHREARPGDAQKQDGPPIVNAVYLERP